MSRELSPKKRTVDDSALPSEKVPLTTLGNSRFPQILNDGVDGARRTSPFDTNLAPDGAVMGSTWKRSQSLPQLSTEKIDNRPMHRIRFLSSRAPQATLYRMRNLSTRTFSAVGAHDENQARGNWENPIEFFLSCLGYAVGLGNVWRFPYLCYRNGGGAFLIPYGMMLFGCGLPLMFMELSLGQYSSEGPLTVWKLAPIFKGLGIGMVLCSCMVAIYYNMITGWSLYYLFLSIREVLPWSCCDPAWGDNCVSFVTDDRCPARPTPEIPMLDVRNFTNDRNFTNETIKPLFAADHFFHKVVLNLGDSIEDLGGIQIALLVSLAFAWLIVFSVLMKGIKSFGKAVYFTSTFPYFILTVLLIRAVMEEGAMDGIKFYLKPQFHMLLKPGVWADAAGQIFYSTGVCFGGAITLASYNRFRNNVYRDAVLVALGNSATSVFSGFVVFSILGFMAHSQNTTVDKIATEGPGLTFIAYPQAVTLLPWSPLWSALFFVMLITLALSTMFPTTENIATAIIDQFPQQLRPYKFWVMMLVCGAMMLLGIPLSTRGGVYVLQMMDSYGVSYALIFLGFVEVTVVAWLYGANRLLDNIQAMVKYRPSAVWRWVWIILTPSLLSFAIIFQFIGLKPQKYGGVLFPRWTSVYGWLLTAISLVPIPVYAVYAVCRFKRGRYGKDMSWWACIRYLMAPTPEWGPALVKYRCVDQPTGDDDVFA